MIANEGNNESDSAHHADNSHGSQSGASKQINPRTETARGQSNPVFDDDVVEELAQENPLRNFSGSGHAGGCRHRGCGASRAAEDAGSAGVESWFRGLHFRSRHSSGYVVD